MSIKSRLFGNNIRVILSRKNIQLENFAEQLGYSVQELYRIMDARLFLTMREREEIANALGVTVDALYQEQEDQVYEEAGCLECRGEFSKPEYKKQILDLFDVYCDIQEILDEEGIKDLSIKSST